MLTVDVRCVFAQEDDDEDSEAGVDWLRSLGLVQDRPSEFHQQAFPHPASRIACRVLAERAS